MQISSNKEGITLFGKTISLCVVISVLSQMPFIVKLGYSSTIAKSVWIFMFIFSFIESKGKVKYKSLFFSIAFGTVLFLYSNLIGIFTGIAYSETELYRSIFLSIFILFISYNAGLYLNKREINVIFQMFSLSSLIVCIVLYFSVLAGANIFTTGYLYTSKNSIAPILMTACIIILFKFVGNSIKKIERLIGIFALCFMTIIIVLLKCRAIIICIPIILLFALFKAPIDKKSKIAVGITIIVIITLLLNEKYYELIINRLFFNGYASDLEKASSGRLSSFFSWWSIFRKVALFGDGHSFFESMPLAALAQFGIFMGGLIIVYALWPLLSSIKMIKENKSVDSYILLILSFTFLIDATFEMLAPFGPGMRSMFLWLFFGFMKAEKDKLSEHRNL